MIYLACYRQIILNLLKVADLAFLFLFSFGERMHCSRANVLPSSDLEMMQYGDVEPSEHMDEHMAALVLTSLSCSPTSPLFPFTTDTTRCQFFHQGI
jgi:hypothetical protein